MAASEEARHPRLGRGLSALLEDENEPKSVAPGAKPRSLPLAFLKPNRFQPRQVFDTEELRELAASIREKGILQAIVVRPTGAPDSYEIVAGERRWRAAQLAQLHEVPVSIREFSDAEALEIAIIENVQRADLNAVEEASAYQELMNRFGYTQEKVSDVVGKSRSHVANTLRLLRLPDSVKTHVREGKLSAGHARTLIGIPDAETRAKEIIAGALSVRQAEVKTKSPKGKARPSKKNIDTKALETSVSNLLGMNVQILDKGEKGGSVVIRYLTLEQLDDIIRRLSIFVEVD